MPKNPDLPKPIPKKISKKLLLSNLRTIDENIESRNRILTLETQFRKKISSHVASLPGRSSAFSKFNTSPFVLMFYCKQKGYSHVSQIEKDILPAKLFSSMETSAGRMVQAVVLPIFGWENVESSMHSSRSVIDGKKYEANLLKLATLKSGPRCLNDEMSKDIADDIVGHAEQWAQEVGVDHIDFTYGVLYGTYKQSNKKDWHILKNIVETIGSRFVIEHPKNKWGCSFRIRGIRVDVSVRIGTDWWSYIGGELAFPEIMTSLIRACVIPTNKPPESCDYTIADLGEIVSTSIAPDDFNVSIIQKSQLEWLFFFARHYCDIISD